MDKEDEIGHEGWMIKSPPNLLDSNPIFKSRWRRRWFVLQRGVLPNEYLLNYYTDDTKRRLKGTIVLDDVEQVDIGLTAENGKDKYEFMFDIKTQKRVYFLAVDTKDEMSTWVRIICAACGLQSTKEQEDAVFNPPIAPSSQAVPTTTEPTSEVAISSPYIHISTCYSGKPPPKPERTALKTSDSSRTTSLPSCGDDSVFEAPEKPQKAEVLAATATPDVMMIQNLTLDNTPKSGLVVLPPGRPPKPAYLATTMSQQQSSATHPQNYANGHDMQEHCQEQNNNSNQEQPGPQISRNLKPGRSDERGFSKTLGSASSSSRIDGGSNHFQHAATLGPPVKRSLKPKGTLQLSGAKSTSSWINNQNADDLSSGESEFDFRRNFETDERTRMSSGSEEQIYFYMPPANAIGEQLMIPADSFEHPSLSYIDLDLSRATTSKPPPKKPPVVNETIYNSVDFEKTEAFNRTKQVVESERYGNHTENAFFN